MQKHEKYDWNQKEGCGGLDFDDNQHVCDVCDKTYLGNQNCAPAPAMWETDFNCVIQVVPVPTHP